MIVPAWDAPLVVSVVAPLVVEQAGPRRRQGFRPMPGPSNSAARRDPVEEIQ